MINRSLSKFFLFGLLSLGFTSLWLAGNTPTFAKEKLVPVEFNLNELVKQAAIGVIAPPGFGDPPYRIDPKGRLHVVPGTGSITFNFRTGDTAYYLAGDHVEPAVTLYNLGSMGSRSSAESYGLNTLACIGNKVKVISGEAKGSWGYVVGKHGGAEHVMVDFPDPSVLEKLVIGDKMQVYTYGVGMKLTNIKDVVVMNSSPFLIETLTKEGMGITSEDKLRIPVALVIPAKIMGSGLGRNHVYRGDYDIQLFDEKTVKEYHLDKIRFGDLVAIINADHTYGRIYRQGAISVGVISHSRSYIAGHGPGVTTLFTSAQGKIEPFVDERANLAYLLGLKK